MKKMRYSPANSQLHKKANLNYLVECFEANPYSNYKVVVWRGSIHSVVEQNIDSRSTMNQI